MEIYCYAARGYDGDIITIEVNIRTRALPGMDIVGLPGGAVKEARERVRAAVEHSGHSFPKGRVLINMAPAGVKKEGAVFDLSVACRILTENMSGEDFLVLGELTLSGNVRPVTGVLPAVAAALEKGIRNFIIPADNAREAAILNKGSVYPAKTLNEALKAIKGEVSPLSLTPDKSESSETCSGDFYELKGQEGLKEALETAAAGMHNLLLFGPPGSGKTMAAARIPSILPPLKEKEALETTRIWSLGGRLKEEGTIISRPPFCSPHHSASLEGIIGGGKYLLPGEVSFAHKGILFLDEIPEFRTSLLQSLREPVEDHRVSVIRAGAASRFPADFQLIATANPCPCGNLGKAEGFCLCSMQEIRRYWKKVGGALMDRIDIRIPVIPSTGDIINEGGQSSYEMRERVLRAVDIQNKRYMRCSYSRNGRVVPGDIQRFCNLTPTLNNFFRETVKKLGISSRGCHSVLKTARTLADLESSSAIREAHLLKAFHYRRYGDSDIYWNEM